MSEDAKDSTFVNALDNLVEDDEDRLDNIEKENKRLSMINQIDMALKYNNVLKVKELMSEDDFLLLSEEDKNKIDLKARLATLEVYEIKLLMEKEEMDKLKLSLEKEKEKNEAAINK